MSSAHASQASTALAHAGGGEAVGPLTAASSAASAGSIPAAAARRRPRTASLVLLVGSVLTGLVIAIVAVDPGRAWLWEPLHWDIAAATGVLTIAVGLRGTQGLVRRIGIGSLVAMSLWLAGRLVWTALALRGAVTLPTIADALALLWIVPGAWMLMLPMHSRLGRAESIAVYLDGAMVFVATTAVLLAIHGPTAYVIGGAAGLLVAVYPAVFIGAAATSLVIVFATRQPLRLDGGVAFAIGTALMGLAFSAWVLPAATGGVIDHRWATLFSIGPLVVSYGAITWQGPTVLPVPQERLAAMVGWTVGPIAVLVTAISAAVAGPIDELEHLVFGMTVVGAALLIVRFALHLQQRTATLEEVRRLLAENERLVERLRLEAQDRERAHTRLSDASRMSAVGELAAAVAHEVNNPLTGVLGYSDLLLADPDLRPDVREDLEIVRAEAMRVRDRVRMLLDFATPRRPDDVSADLGEVVSAPMALLRYHLERRGLIVEERYAPTAPILLDPAAIQQVLINLVTEISSAMPSGGRLAVATEVTSDGASVVLDASGQGFDVGAIRSADSPFADEDGRDEPQGAMAASIGVLRGHDATIGVRVATDEHIRIEIHLPRRASTSD